MSKKDRRFKRCPFCGQLNELHAELCGECRRPLVSAEVVESSDKFLDKSDSTIVIERFEKTEGKEIPSKEIPRLELESAAEVLNRSIFGREKAASEEALARKGTGEKYDFKLVDLKGEDFVRSQVTPTSSKQESAERPKESIVSFYEAMERKKRAEIEEIRRKELAYWHKVRVAEQLILFTSRVIPWFAMASLIAFVIVPFTSKLFPQGTWEGRIFDSTSSVTFKMVLSREGTQLTGSLQFLDNGWSWRFPFVLEGIVVDKDAPLRVRGSFKLRKISLAIYPEESEMRKVILDGKWTRKKASGDARNFWGINAKWSMERL